MFDDDLQRLDWQRSLPLLIFPTLLCEFFGLMVRSAIIFLRNLQLNRYLATPTMILTLLIPTSPRSTLSGQTVTICANSSCCGCQAAWTTAASCTTEIATCANCTGSAPPEYPSATCSNGYYIIPSSFTGGLTINGKAAVMGDLTVPAGDMLGFVGFSSFLNVTGSVTLKSYAIVIAATDDDAAYLKAVGSRLFVSVSYMYVANPIRKAGTYTGYNSLVTVHTKRACKKPTATSSSAGTDYNNWTVAISYGSSCNTWWIIVLSLAAPFLVGLVGVTCSLMEQISKHC